MIAGFRVKSAGYRADSCGFRVLRGVDDEASRQLGGYSRQRIYVLLDLGELRSCRIGRRRLIETASLRDLCERNRVEPAEVPR